jgi:hypothetical protein
MMDFKEQGSSSEQAGIDKNKELVEQFPIFDKLEMEDGSPIYVEYSAYRDHEDKFKDEDPRMFLLASGPVMLSTGSLIDSEYLWKMEEDRELLLKLIKFVEEDNGSNHFRLGVRNYNVVTFEYGDEGLVGMLEDKVRKRNALKKGR